VDECKPLVRGACGTGGGAVGTAVFGDAACAAAMVGRCRLNR